MTLGTEPSPGFYAYRARKGAPLQAMRIINFDGAWIVLVNGTPMPGSGADDWVKVPILLRWPFHPITHDRYLELIKAAEDAPPGHPLAEPDKPVDLKRNRSLF
jgi:hypothetical protein